jgi:hypothetical protein
MFDLTVGPTEEKSVLDSKAYPKKQNFIYKRSLVWAETVKLAEEFTSKAKNSMRT